MKYAVIITYSNGQKTGATVRAEDRAAAWLKLFEFFRGGEDLEGVQISQILVNDREIR